MVPGAVRISSRPVPYLPTARRLAALVVTYPVVILTGESGTGKTSLLRAGLSELDDEGTVYPPHIQILAGRVLADTEAGLGLDRHAATWNVFWPSISTGSCSKA